MSVIRHETTPMMPGDRSVPVRRHIPTHFLLLGLAVAGVLACIGEAGASLVVNGDFSAGNTGFTSQYTFVASGPTIAGQYSIVANPGLDLANGDASFGDHTTGSGLMFFGDGGLATRAAYSLTLDVVPGMEYEVSLWVANTNGLASPTLRLTADGFLIASRTPAAIAGAWENITATFEATSPTVLLRLVNVVNQVTPQGRNFVLDDVAVTLQGVGNEPPTINDLADRWVDEQTTLAFQVTANDTETPSGLLTYEIDYDSTTASATITPGGALSYSPGENDGPGDYVVRVVVRDDGTPQQSTAGTFALHVREVNRAPVLDPIGCLRGTENQELTFTARGHDLDRPFNALTYSLDPGTPAGATIDPISGVFSWTPDETQGPGSYAITVRVTDDGPPPLDAAETITIDVPEAPDGVNLLVNGDFEAGFSGFVSHYVFRGDGTVTNAGEFAVANSTAGSIAGGFAPFVERNGCNGRMLFASGPSFVPSLWAQTVPVSPRRKYTLSFWAAPGSSVPGVKRLTIQINGTPLPGSFALTGPGGFWRNLEATFTSGEETSLSVSIQLTGLGALDDLVLTDVGPADAPLLDPIADIHHDEMSPLAFTVTASDPDVGQVLSYSLGAGAPAGATITPAGQFSWTPDESQGPADHSITVVAADNGILPLHDERTFVVHVREVNLPPVLTVPGCSRGLEAVPLALAVNANDPDLPPNPLVYALGPGAPAGMTIDSGTGVISWLPGSAGAGLFPITIRVSDSGAPPLEDSENLVVDVAETDGGGPNLVVNGDFEAGPVGYTSEYSYINGGFTQPTEHSVVMDPSLAFTNGYFSLSDHTSCHGLMLFADGGPASLELWTQEIPVVPGTEYAFSYWARPAIGPNPAVLRVTVDGVTIGGDLAIAEAPGWLRYRGVFTAGAGSSVRVAIQDVNPDSHGLGNDLVIDDIAMNALTPSNRPPVTSITSPAAGALYAVEAPVVLSGTYADPDAGDTHVAQWFIDDLPHGPMTAVTGGTATLSTTLPTAGVYMLRLRITDQGGLFGEATQVGEIQAMIVVYDPDGGFVTGGGWIQSPAGAYVAGPTLTGKATFGFVSKYQRGATIPTGETEFNFKTAGFKFTSTSYEWLVVSPSRAQYKGLGSVNGGAGYRFMLTAIDGDQQGASGPDRFRLRVWNAGTGAPVYDNQHSASDHEDPVTTLGGGSIVIHKTGDPRTSETAGARPEVAPTLAFAIHDVRPNPVRSGAVLALDLPESGEVEAGVFDVSGRRVSGIARTELPEGSHAIRWDARDQAGGTLAPGLYFVRVRATLTGTGRSITETRKLFVSR